MPFDPLYLIVVVPAGLAVFGLMVFIIRHGITLRREDSQGGSPVEQDCGPSGELLVKSMFVIGVPWLVVVALWGFKAGLGFSVIAAAAGFSNLAFGGFGGQWVGPGAADLTSLLGAPMLLLHFGSQRELGRGELYSCLLQTSMPKPREATRRDLNSPKCPA